MPAELARVTPLGELTRRQLAREMGCAAIFAAPARYEPFGLAALEAALSGCALSWVTSPANAKSGAMLRFLCALKILARSVRRSID
jgi:hypothetical protein